MSTNESVDARIPSAETYKNFNDYFVHQAVTAQKEYNWDGYRWVGTACPIAMSCDGTEAAYCRRRWLRWSTPGSGSEGTACGRHYTALQLPSTNGNIPHYTTEQ